MEIIQEYAKITTGDYTEINGKAINCFELLYKVLRGDEDKSCIDVHVATDFIEQLELEQEVFESMFGQRSDVFDKLIVFLKDIL